MSYKKTIIVVCNHISEWRTFTERFCFGATPISSTTREYNDTIWIMVRSNQTDELFGLRANEAVLYHCQPGPAFMEAIRALGVEEFERIYNGS